MPLEWIGEKSKFPNDPILTVPVLSLVRGTSIGTVEGGRNLNLVVVVL